MSGDSPDRRRPIFISYRRRVGAPSAELLFGRLEKRLGDGLIFYDVIEIKPGELFPQRLRDALNDCEIVLAVIDPEWANERHASGPQQGQRRLDDPQDWVRIELETALNGGKLLVPLLAYPTSRCWPQTCQKACGHWPRSRPRSSARGATASTISRA
jgi:hypothetical protein